MINKYRLTLSFAILAIIVIGGGFLARCKSKDRKTPETNSQTDVGMKDRFGMYAGNAVCAGCHQNIQRSHAMTSHARTSMPADEKSILGSFSTGQNRYTYNPALYMVMEKTDTGLYQSVFYQGEKKRSFRFDIITGSGAKGQTYLYWDSIHLFQMPISYFTAPSQWSVSPGFPPDKVLFDKPITSRCLECHATYAAFNTPPQSKHEVFDRNQILFGVDCEKCHGPGAEHAAFHSKNPADSTPHRIINPRDFSRQQKLDMCVLCHGGSMKKTKPSFSFMPSDKLEDYFITDTTRLHADNVDVHGNQFGLLRGSPCFMKSSTMTCNTCHDTHVNERGNLRLFSSRCMQCHQEGGHYCKVHPRPSNLKENCIDCHMPKKPSMAVTLYLQGQDVPTPAMIRTHFISIYPLQNNSLKSVMDKPRN